MFSLWAIATAVLLWIINSIVGVFGNLAVLSMGKEPFWWNVSHILLLTGASYSLGYGIRGVTLGCIFGILINLFILIVRLKTEYFEWK